ncbi:tetratricopeptide repeat protein, partial [Kibdelosporangium lantanae]
CHARLGDQDRARAYCESALNLCRQHDDLYGQADNLDALGAIATHTHQHAEAARNYEQAFALWSTIDNTYRQADTLANLGRAQASLGHHEKAHTSWRQAIDLYRLQNRDTEADQTERLLADNASALG